MNRVIIIISVIIILASCRAHKQNNYIEYKKMKEYSELNIPFKLNREEIETAINKFVPDTLFDTNSNEELNFQLKVFKKDISNIELSGQKISASLTLDVIAKKDFILTNVSATGTIMLDFSTYIDVDPNWHILSNTSLDNYHWIEKPVVDLTIVKFSPAKALEKFIDYKKEEWMAMIDDMIYENDFIEKKMDSLLITLQKPFPLDTYNVAGVKIQPMALSFVPFTSYIDTIEGRVKLKLNTDIVLLNEEKASSQKPEQNIKKAHFYWDYSENNTGKSVLSLRMHKTKIQSIANKYLESMPVKDKTFDVKGRKIVLQKVEIDFKQGIFAIKTFFTGEANGTFYLSAYPQWDFENKKMFFTESKTKITIDDFRAKIMLSLFKKTIKKKIIRAMEKHINLIITDAFKQINTMYNDKNGTNLKITGYDIPVGIENDEAIMNVEVKIAGKIKIDGLTIEL